MALLVNASTLSVVKYGSAIHSCIVGNLKTILLWLISVIFMGEVFNWLEMIGFIVFVLIGSLIYNEVIRCPKRKLGKAPMSMIDESNTKIN